MLTQEIYLQNNARFDKMCYIGIDIPMLEFGDTIMDNTTVDTVANLYQDAIYPVILFDETYHTVWKNKIALSHLFEYTDTEMFRKNIFTPENETKLEQNGFVFLRPGADFADLHGIMLTKVHSGIVVAFDHSDMTLNPIRKYSTDGFDSFSSLVRSNIDRLTLSAASVEYAVNSDDPDIEQMFANIRMSSYEILRGLNNAALLAKYVTGAVSLDKRNCDVGELVRALCLSVQSVLKTRIEIDVTVKDGPVIANIDVKLCERALLNLLCNSIRFTRDDNRITVTVSENANDVNIVVRDRGAGIKEENIALVTKPYFSVEPANDGGSAPGLGLGLSVAAAFCEAHGGTLILNSRFGEGTMVALSFAKDVQEAPCFRAAVSSYVTDRFSPLYIELCGLCEIPK